MTKGQFRHYLRHIETRVSSPDYEAQSDAWSVFPEELQVEVGFTDRSVLLVLKWDEGAPYCYRYFKRALGNAETAGLRGMSAVEFFEHKTRPFSEELGLALLLSSPEQ